MVSTQTVFSISSPSSSDIPATSSNEPSWLSVSECESFSSFVRAVTPSNSYLFCENYLFFFFPNWYNSIQNKNHSFLWKINNAISDVKKDVFWYTINVDIEEMRLVFILNYGRGNNSEILKGDELWIHGVQVLNLALLRRRTARFKLMSSFTFFSDWLRLRFWFPFQSFPMGTKKNQKNRS